VVRDAGPVLHPLDGPRSRPGGDAFCVPGRKDGSALKPGLRGSPGLSLQGASRPKASGRGLSAQSTPVPSTPAARLPTSCIMGDPLPGRASDPKFLSTSLALLRGGGRDQATDGVASQGDDSPTVVAQ